ncbi:MAG: ubiquinol-cytochrome c reductase iron-sulfur subunit [Gammaproteobacteria bacterium]|nr:ubiquinol-cytochrome c reductase iron-sulfur subunit [Gammaproteobacteria bacterium]MCP4088587.1 ubiquinol-cytochrome c reductase iron-sulfur subunit [Gammaproteobacteria bacterium]MCP4276505.1 ubiquinol-cytochrome c reductase iron-sulfur subunit [Gammaproteobacteria bacterium]MCP4832382.1 ubiquinol-cytochrome c reductase iron-sulfur subunit [Gammaproteobacteria bacterium]MCP4929104.1 ubiquinol-cytochrome c reductase iron-sulfur subunit [Gammaproteobacteria bacterium]
MSEDSGLSRRRFLNIATSVTGAVGAVAVAVPFISSWQPSARARALGAPVEVDISKLEDGAMMRVIWRGTPVSILKRSPEMLNRLENEQADLQDRDSKQEQQPAYAQNEYRSIKPELLVLISNCTHLGCVPTNRFEVAPADLGPDWVGGFFCPCHGSKFDLAGRVFSGVPAPLNLLVPPYRYVGDNVLIIGEDTEVAA